MRRGGRTSIAAVAIAATAGVTATARADEHEHQAAAMEVEPFLSPQPAQMPYALPRQTMIPGTPGMAGGIHLMVNAFGMLEN